jgi:ribosomal protein S3
VLQVIVKGKVRAQRAKAMKFGDGYMVSSGHPAKIYLEKAFTHVQMRQGSIGIKVSPLSLSPPARFDCSLPRRLAPQPR